LNVKGIQERQVSALFSSTDNHSRGEKEIERLAALGGVALSFEDGDYPPLLRQLFDPPPVLYIQGRSDLLSSPGVAVVGSRAATSYGRKTAFNLSRNLAAWPVTVISGLALGIDTESHLGALAAPGSTVAILGCGLDVVYPLQNRSLYKQIAERGALVTEYPLGTRPDGFRFPARNRIIAGLSQGVIVVEAAKKSGSLITAQMALDCGREVFAVPGQVDSCKNKVLTGSSSRVPSWSKELRILSSNWICLLLRITMCKALQGKNILSTSNLMHSHCLHLLNPIH
jgi:DNA processing protein